MKRIRLKITIQLLTPLHVGGEPGENTNMAYILRDADGKPYYPGTAFKGKVRHYALYLQKDICRFPEPCGCGVCRLFGGEGNARGSLVFGNFHPVGESEIDIRAGNSIDRFRRVAEDEKLFLTESAVIHELVGYVTGNADNDEINLLKESIKFIRQIGGKTSRGFGWVKDEIAVSEEPLDAQETQHKLGGSAACIRVKLTPKSPMLIGTHTTQSNFRDTRYSIPGAVLRAAMARSLCEQDGSTNPSAEGIRWVMPIEGSTSFPNLRQAFSDLRFSVLNSNIQPEPYPITMRKCKSNKKHKRVDILAMLLGENRESKQVCPECTGSLEGRLEKVDPYEEFAKSDDDAIITVTSTHSEMDKLRGTSRDGRLFSVRAVAPEAAVFCGTISGDLDLGEVSLMLQSPLRVGAMLSSGFGKCDMEIEPVAETADDMLLDRIRDFNKLVMSDKVFVPITLISDAIVELEEPDDGDFIQAYEELVPFALELVITKPRVWRGFDTSQKENFEKEARFLLQAGSVFVVRVDDLEGPTIEKLLTLERHGIGKETKDGYGAVRVAHNYHIKNALIGG